MIILRKEKLKNTVKGSLKGVSWGSGIGYATGAGIALSAGDGIKDAHKAGILGAGIGAGLGLINGGRIGYKKPIEVPKKKEEIKQLSLQEFKQALPPQYHKWYRLSQSPKTIAMRKEIDKFNRKVYPTFRVCDIEEMLEEYNSNGFCTILWIADYGPSMADLSWDPIKRSWLEGVKNPEDEIKYIYDCLLEELVEEFYEEDEKFLNAVENFIDYIKERL